VKNVPGAMAMIRTPVGAKNSIVVNTSIYVPVLRSALLFDTFTNLETFDSVGLSPKVRQ
jgi:hypothetical protein